MRTEKYDVCGSNALALKRFSDGKKRRSAAAWPFIADEEYGVPPERQSNHFALARAECGVPVVWMSHRAYSRSADVDPHAAHLRGSDSAQRGADGTDADDHCRLGADIGCLNHIGEVQRMQRVIGEPLRARN
jgi:hypothetical protein